MFKSSILNRGFTLWLVMFAILLALLPHPVYACSCVPVGPPADALEDASAVFAGKVINVQTPISVIQSSADPVRYVFAVSQVWKGPAYKHLAVYSARDGASCGVGFPKGAEYLVYTYGEESHLQVSLCSRTQPLERAAEDLTALGEGTIPTEENPSLTIVAISPLSPLTTAGNTSPPICVFPIALISVLPIGAMMRRARRRAIR
jgi:hypothetical protein